VYNVAFGGRTTLNELFALIRGEVARYRAEAASATPTHGPFREGDVRHSLADVSKAAELLGYRPGHTIREGLRLAADWYSAAARG
jgi:UDP-N-acetylglucosamine 4-epimerase